MLEELSVSELAAWLAYYQLEPFGEWRADVREAMHMALLANVNRKKGGKAYKAEQFMPTWDERDKAQSDGAAMMLAFKAMTEQEDEE